MSAPVNPYASPINDFSLRNQAEASQNRFSGDATAGRLVGAVEVTPQMLVHVEQVIRGKPKLLLRIACFLLPPVVIGSCLIDGPTPTFWQVVMIFTNGLLFSLIPAAILLGPAWLKRRAIYQSFRRRGLEKDLLRYEVHSDHLRIQDSWMDARIPWSSFTMWNEKEGVIVARENVPRMILIGHLDQVVATTIRDQLIQHVGAAEK